MPAEITAKIFKLAQLHDTEFQDNINVPDDEWCWLTITHVCKLWREIAIGTQDLWTHIDIEKLSGIEQTAMYLARSGASQLVVHYDCEQEESLQSLFLALAHIHRIKELHIWTLPVLQFPEEVRLALFRSAAPALQKFSLTMGRGVTDVFDARYLFKGQAPNLRGLYLNANSPSWANAPVIRNLEFLRIDTDLDSLDLQDLFSILAENPNIQRLSLASLKNNRQINSRAILTPIPLLSLQDLEISANYNILRQFLRNITIPNLNAWIFNCNTYPIILDTSTNPRSVIPNTFYNGTKICWSLNLSISPMMVAIVTDDPDDHNGQRLGNALNHNYPKRALNCYRNDETDENHMLMVPVVDKFHHICSIIDGGFWGTARSLTVDFNTCTSEPIDLSVIENLGAAPWTRLLYLFPALRELNVQRYGSIQTGDDGVTKVTYCGLLEALESIRVDNEGVTQLICPNLRVLRIKGMDLEDGEDLLIDALCFRAALTFGQRLERLVLRDSFGLTAAVFDNLQRRGVAENIECA